MQLAKSLATYRATRSPALRALLLGTVMAAGSNAGCLAESSDAEYLVERADAARGGLLWDRFWVVPGVLESIEPGKPAAAPDGMSHGQPGSSVTAHNPLYATNPAENLRRGPETWRCVECHGWDYLGERGEYGNNSHRTGFPGVWEFRDNDVDMQFDKVADGGRGHDFAKVLWYEDIADLVKFVREGLVHRSRFANAAGTAGGDVAKGQALFQANCVGCHGDDGRQLNLAEGEVGERYVGDVALEEPGRFLHKVRLGQPDGSMPPAAASGLLLEDVGDLLTYAQALGRVQGRALP